MARVYELRDELLALSVEDRANLIALVEHDEATRAYEPTREDQEVWGALHRLVPMPHRSLTKFLDDRNHGVSRKAWRDAVGELYSFAGQAETVRHKAEDQAALVELALSCLASDLRRTNSVLSARSLLQALPRLYNAVDRCFPGYVEAGLLHRLIRVSEPVAAE